MKPCYRCGVDNPVDQAFCGSCGAATSLPDFISGQVDAKLADAVKDRSVLETESAIRVFQRAFDWMKYVLGIAVAVLGLGTFYGLYQLHDLHDTVQVAEKSVNSTANDAKANIKNSSAEVLKGIQTAAGQAVHDSQKATADASKARSDVMIVSAKSRGDIQRAALEVKGAAQSTTTELKKANELQPEIVRLKDGLQQTTQQLEGQKKLLSSTQDFAKQVFSSRVEIEFGFPSPELVSKPLTGPTVVTPTYVIVPAQKTPDGPSQTIVYMLLPSVPISNTLSLQYHIFNQPAHSFITVQNLVVFFWGDPPENLKQHTLQAGYFPDLGNTDIARTLTIKDGRVYADDMPLLKFGQADLDYKGSRWFKIQNAPAP